MLEYTLFQNQGVSERVNLSISQDRSMLPLQYLLVCSNHKYKVNNIIETEENKRVVYGDDHQWHSFHASFNLTRPSRRRIDGHYNPKCQYSFSECLRNSCCVRNIIMQLRNIRHSPLWRWSICCACSYLHLSLC